MEQRQVTRSRAYPVLDLEAACRILRERLRNLGTEPVQREELARLLGYASGAGGGAARKIAALVHYGLLQRSHSGSYRLDRLGFQILRSSPGSPEMAAALRSALEQPVLFRSILATHRSHRRLPLDLPRILSDEHGITENASEDAARVFVDSAVFAGVLDTDRTTFLLVPAYPSGPVAQSVSSDEDSTLRSGHRVQIPLTHLKTAWLVVPPGVTDDDLKEIDDWWQKFGTSKLRIYLGLDVGKPATFRPRAVPNKSKGATDK